MSEYKQTITKLILSEISSYKIHKETGRRQTVLSILRKGTRDLDKTTENLYEYAETHLNL
ncbi:hypothetical protein BU067_13545 [Staphylococcus succinus]|nr:hypothetical protein BU067_13545 [Staphylococcus succinus]RIN38402.1 hypothetical protein BU059_13680 [Staphylococcus succinus]